MNRLTAISVALPMILAMTPGLGADWKALQGTYAVTPEGYLDADSAQRKDSHLRIQLRGQAAKDLFLSMKVGNVKDDCTGAAMRRVGSMRCLQYSKPVRHECDFSIDVMAQKIEYGVTC